MKKRVQKKSKSLFSIANVIVVSVTFILCVSVVAEIFIPSYKTNPLLYALMGTVVGLLLRSMNQN